jgi:magnesium-transporting ATPase (P-type)
MRTMVMTTLAVSQILHLGNARSDEPVLRWRRAMANPMAVGGVALALALQVMAVTVAPLAAVLHLTPLEPWEWLIALSLGAVPAIAGQATKALSQSAGGEI